MTVKRINDNRIKLKNQSQQCHQKPNRSREKHDEFMGSVSVLCCYLYARQKDLCRSIVSFESFFLVAASIFFPLFYPQRKRIAFFPFSFLFRISFTFITKCIVPVSLCCFDMGLFSTLDDGNIESATNVEPQQRRRRKMDEKENKR